MTDAVGFDGKVEAISNRDDYVIRTQMNDEIGIYLKHLA